MKRQLIMLALLISASGNAFSVCKIERTADGYALINELSPGNKVTIETSGSEAYLLTKLQSLINTTACQSAAKPTASIPAPQRPPVLMPPGPAADAVNVNLSSNELLFKKIQTLEAAYTVLNNKITSLEKTAQELISQDRVTTEELRNAGLTTESMHNRLQNIETHLQNVSIRPPTQVQVPQQFFITEKINFCQTRNTATYKSYM
jgi:hypothetical protein